MITFQTHYDRRQGRNPILHIGLLAPANCDLAVPPTCLLLAIPVKIAWSGSGRLSGHPLPDQGGDGSATCSLVGAGNFTPVLRHLEDILAVSGQRLRIIDMTPEGALKLRVDHCQFASPPTAITKTMSYNTSDLRDLPGRKIPSNATTSTASRRNKYEYRYEPMTSDHAAECMRLEAEWRKTRSGRTGELSAEQRAMQRAFAHFDRLGLIGGCIYVGDNLSLSTYGSPINDHTFFLSVGRHRIDGAFTHHQPGVSGAPARAIHTHRTQGTWVFGTTAGQSLPASGIPREEIIYGPLPLSRDEIACKRLWIKVLRTTETFIDSFPDRSFLAQADARSRRGRPSGGPCTPDPVRKRAGAHDYIWRGDRPRLPGPGPDLRIDARGDGADRRRRGRRRDPYPKPGKPQGLLRPVRLRRPVASGRFQSAGRLRLRLNGQSGTGSGYGLAPQQQRTAARTFALPASLIPQRTVPQKYAGRLEASGRTLRSFRTPASARSDPKIPLFRRRSDRLSTKSTKNVEIIANHSSNV